MRHAPACRDPGRGAGCHTFLPVLPPTSLPIATQTADMDREELFETWQANKGRPVWVRENREAIHEHTDLDEDIPDSSPASVRRWLDRFKGTVTRQLNDDTGGTDPHDGESVTTDDAEGDA